MKKRILLLVFISFCMYSCLSQQNEIIFKINASKHINKGEPVEITLNIINNSDKEINIYSWEKKTITQAINDFLIFEIKKDNKLLNYNYVGIKVLLPYKDDFITIMPDSTYSEIINLLNYYITSEEQNNKQKREWSEGKYEILCRYKYKHDENYKYGQNLWEGELISNKITIEIE
jgi:hypothetical protein